MSKKYQLLTGLQLQTMDKDGKTLRQLPLGQFVVDGTEEQIFWKVNHALCRVFAMHESNSQEAPHFERNLEIYKKKYLKSYENKH